MIGCGGGHNKGKAGAGGAHVPLKTTDVDVSKRCGFSEPVHCLCSHQCATVAKHPIHPRVWTPSAPTVSAVLVLTARCHHTMRRQCMKSD